MIYAAMIFFILAVVMGLFGFTSFEDGGEPGAAAMARLLAVAFTAGFGFAALAVFVGRFGMGKKERGATRQTHSAVLGSGTGVSLGWSASERGSWDGARRGPGSRTRRTARQSR